jgi:hypothetical protein
MKATIYNLEETFAILLQRSLPIVPGLMLPVLDTQNTLLSFFDKNGLAKSFPFTDPTGETWALCNGIAKLGDHIAYHRPSEMTERGIVHWIIKLQ